MCRKLFLLALVLGLVSIASAAPTWVGTVSSSWGTGGNWNTGVAPVGTADRPFIGWYNTDSMPNTPIFTASDNFSVNKFNIGGTDKGGYMEMTGGTLAVGTSGIFIGNSSRGDLVQMDMSGGLLSSTGQFRIGRRSVASFNMSGGTLDVRDYKPGPRPGDTAYGLGVTYISFNSGWTTDGTPNPDVIINVDKLGFEASSTSIGNATMVIDSTATIQVPTAIDAQIDNALANNWLTAYGHFSGTTVNGIEYLIIKSWNAFGDILTVTSVPEPATIALLGLGGLALLRRRR